MAGREASRPVLTGVCDTLIATVRGPFIVVGGNQCAAVCEKTTSGYKREMGVSFCGLILSAAACRPLHGNHGNCSNVTLSDQSNGSRERERDR